MNHMKDPNRYVPESIVGDVIRYPIRTGPDPRGTSAKMYYSTMRRNGKLYNIEILYDSKQNSPHNVLTKTIRPYARYKVNRFKIV